MYHLHETNAVEAAAALHKEACELRLARIQNGAEPTHKNGAHVVTLVSLEAEGKRGWQYQSTSGRKSGVFRGKQAAQEWRMLHPAWD